MARRPVTRSRAGRRCLLSAELSATLAVPDTLWPASIASTVRQFGIAGCLSRMAQESGDHPEAAATRYADMSIAFSDKTESQ